MSAGNPEGNGLSSVDPASERENVGIPKRTPIKRRSSSYIGGVAVRFSKSKVFFIFSRDPEDGTARVLMTTLNEILVKQRMLNICSNFKCHAVSSKYMFWFLFCYLYMRFDIFIPYRSISFHDEVMINVLRPLLCTR